MVPAAVESGSPIAEETAAVATAVLIVIVVAVAVVVVVAATETADKAFLVRRYSRCEAARGVLVLLLLLLVSLSYVTHTATYTRDDVYAHTREPRGATGRD